MKNHKLKVGDTLVAIWGYDATFYDFFKVLAVTKSMVILQEYEKTRYTNENHNLHEWGVTPDFEKPKGEPFKRKVSPGGESVRVCSTRFAMKHKLRSNYSEDNYH